MMTIKKALVELNVLQQEISSAQAALNKLQRKQVELEKTIESLLKIGDRTSMHKRKEGYFLRTALVFQQSGRQVVAYVDPADSESGITVSFVDAIDLEEQA